MQKKAVIVSCSALTALGDLEETWKALIERKSGLIHHRLPGMKESFPLGLVTGIDGKTGSLQRLTDMVRQCAKSHPLLKEAAVQGDLIIATTKGAVDELVENSSEPFKGQPWQIGELIGKELAIRKQACLINAACASGTLALIQATRQLTDITGNCKVVIVVGIDLLSSFVTAGFASLKALTSNACRPFDKNRDGLALGEGIGLIIIAENDFAEKQGWKPLAEIKGAGVACDAKHITAPCRKGSGLYAALVQTTGNRAFPVGAMNVHGTGTIYNDAMELTAFKSFWNNAVPALHSIKGAVGHCLGAAGVIETGVAVLSLLHKMIPATTGLDNPECLDLKISGTKSYTLSHPSILACNSGFGGINAALLLNSCV